MNVSATNTGGYKVALKAGSHDWLCDRPVGEEGSDLGPTPHELLLGSLAACKVITVQMSAQRKGWPLTGVNISLGYQQIKGDSTLEKFDGEIQFLGELTDEQRQRLHEIAAKCPVHRILTNPVEITLTLAAG